ncbi:hypothetical protein, partial [Streptomyces clavuligerus]|uniref:hypothetical protein n=1 Tax=Streptomyces clavuligerus TaxID=1901 RepID=UPI001E5E6141
SPRGASPSRRNECWTGTSRGRSPLTRPRRHHRTRTLTVTSSLVTATAALGAGMPGRDNEGADPAVGTGQFLRWAINHLTTADAVLRLDVYTDDSHHAGGG